MHQKSTQYFLKLDFEICGTSDTTDTIRMSAGGAYELSVIKSYCVHLSAITDH